VNDVLGRFVKKACFLIFVGFSDVFQTSYLVVAENDVRKEAVPAFSGSKTSD
jgi:hypothetical protein